MYTEKNRLFYDFLLLDKVKDIILLTIIQPCKESPFSQFFKREDLLAYSLRITRKDKVAKILEQFF
jgi:hypothetical protein